MRIANIIHEKELVNHTKADYINYYNEPVMYLNGSLPTLYVGWEFMKACNPRNPIISNAEILMKKIITDELYWEFSFKENKAAHVKGVNNFVEAAPEYYFSPKYTYINLDPVGFNLRDIQDLMDVVPKQMDSLYIYKNDMVYLLKGNKITGINLKMYEFFKFNIPELLSRLKGRTSFLISDDFEGEIYQSYYKIFPKFELLKRYLVTILSK
jgi:hypothetical protein